MEIWKSVISFPEYEVSDLGNVRRIKAACGAITGKNLSPWIANNGYRTVVLSTPDKRKYRTVHSLVAEAFIGPRPYGDDICHANGDRLDNRLSNLRYDTRKNNVKDSQQHGTAHKGERTGGALLTSNQVIEIRALKKTGLSAAKIAKRYGVSANCIYGAVKYNWKHIRA